MSWAKFDDRCYDHPKVVEAGPHAERLWMRSIIWCSRHRTDGFVPSGAVRVLNAPATGWKNHAAKLVKVGLWEETDDGYRVHDFLEYNPSAEKLDEQSGGKSSKRSAAGKKGAASRWQNDGKAIAKGMANGWQTDGPVPVPVPVPNKKKTHTDDLPCDSDGKRMANGWQTNGKPHGKRMAKRDGKNGKTSDAIQVADYYRQVNPGLGRALVPGNRWFKSILSLLSLKENPFSVQDLCSAVDGNRIEKWHVENKKHSADFVFRNAEKVESLIAAARPARENGSSSPPLPEEFLAMIALGNEHRLGALLLREYEHMKSLGAGLESVGPLVDEMTADPVADVCWPDVVRRLEESGARAAASA